MKSSANKFAILVVSVGAIALGALMHPGIHSQAILQEAQSPQTKATWLTESLDARLVQMERHFRGLDVSMAEIGHRYHELLNAVKYRNWDYAQYQTEKIDLSLRLAIERRPKRAKSAVLFLDERIPPVLEAIKARHSEQIDEAVVSLRNGCIQCHRAENVLYMGNEFALIQQTPDSIAESISHAKMVVTPESLANANRSQGRQVFSERCAKCHRLFGEGSDVGPDLTSLQRSNLDYLLTRIIDPNSLIGLDYQQELLLLDDGRTMIGLVTKENDETVTLYSGTEEITVYKSEIDQRSTTKVSMMPADLIKEFSIEQLNDLVVYLQGDEQVPLPTDKGH